MEKQIEEIAKELKIDCEQKKESDCYGMPCSKCRALYLYNAGYRKQSEGEWKLHKDGSGTCDQCGGTQKNVWDYDGWQNYCGRCGAHMKGGEE